MTRSSSPTFSALAEDFGERWNRFWFTPADPLPAAVLRIAVGVIAIAHFLDLAGGLQTWYARDGLLPPTAVQQLLELTSGDAEYHPSYLKHFAGTELVAAGAIAIALAICFTLGLLTRITGLLTLVAMLAYVHRVPQIAGHLEPVLSFLLLYLCIAPSGACLSIDSRLFGAAGNGPLRLLIGRCEPSRTANLGLRLIQIHLAMFYAMMGLTKLYGDAWWDGEAIWLLMAQTESRPLDLTGLRRAGQFGEYVLNFWTHAFVYFELAFPVLIWTRVGRPLLLGLSVVIWLSLIVVTGQLLFGLLMLAAGVAFIRAPIDAALASSSAARRAAPTAVT
jgi:hypothetical protein